MLRRGVIGVAVAGMIATAAVPAIGAFLPRAEAASDAGRVTLHQVAEDGAQEFVAASSVVAAAVTRDGYSATTPDEIAKKKAEEEAIKRAAEAAAAAAARAAAEAAGQADLSDVDLVVAVPGTGTVAFPLGGIPTYGDGFRSRGGSHDGVDLLIAGGTPIYATTSGTVVVSSDAHWGYGVAVEVVGNMGGTDVKSLYAHMTTGTRAVAVGQHVEAGQLLGLVGSTGNSTANHLHFEVELNGSLVDPIAWLNANGVPAG